MMISMGEEKLVSTLVQFSFSCDPTFGALLFVSLDFFVFKILFSRIVKPFDQHSCIYTTIAVSVICPPPLRVNSFPLPGD